MGDFNHEATRCDDRVAAWAAVAATAEARTAFDNIPANLRVTKPAEFAAFIKSEDQRWGELIRKLGIKAD